MVRLRFFDPDGTELDTVIIYRDGNSASIPARAVAVEVTTVAEDAMDTIIEGLRNH